MATRNLGQVSAIHIGTVEPQNKDLIWRDASQNPRLWKVWNSVTSVWEVVPSQAVANNFLNLGDTPVSYTGSGGKILKVKANLSGIEFVDETTYSSEIDAAIDKAVLSDSDEFLLSDAGTVKKTKWSQIKSSLKSYFDTLYVSVSTVTNQLISNWNEAFSWGDHSQEGYLTNETDPIFTSHPASSVVNSGDGTKYLSDDGAYKEVSGGLASIAEETNEAIREIEKYENGNDVFNYTTGSLYEYDSAETEADDNDNFLEPNNSTGNGRWVKRQDFAKSEDIVNKFDNLTDTPTTKIPKKLVKVSDDGEDLNYTDYDADEVVQKAETYNVGTLKKFDSDGNDEDSGLTGESLDIYDITSQLILALENDNNWLDSNGDQILGSVLFSDGIKGQRYYSDDFYFECVNDFRWVRTFTGRPVIDIYNNPKLTLLEKSYLEDDANWENGSYIGVSMEDVAQGTRYYDNEYVYEFIENNTPVRYLRS